MSLNQSRSDKNESQFRRTGGGRSGGSGQNRTFPGGSGKGGGGPTTAPTPSTNPPSLSSNRSFKKPNNVQGGQPRPGAGYVNTSESNTAAAATRSTQNGSHVQPQPASRGSTVASTTATPKPSDAAQKSSKTIPKAPSSTINPSSMAPATPPVKAPGDSSKGFPLQFGSISPGLMNGMQVPARTSSAPPNLDEQKREQARNDSLRAPPAVPIPSAPKPQLPKKEAVPTDQLTVSGGSYPDSKPKKDIHIKPAPHQSQPQKPSVAPLPGISVPPPYHQPPVSMQFGGHNPQIQSHAMPPSSLQMPMSMQMQMQIGNSPQVQQQVFLPGLQHHMMQPQGMMAQGQSMGFTPQMTPHLPPHQMGNMGMNRPTHFSPQQAGKFGSARKTVKITHPDTHEELRLDKRADVYPDGASSASRNAPPPQPVPTYASSHPSSYYPTPYSAGPPFFPASSSIPLTSSPLHSVSQPPRFSYPVSQGPQTLSFMDQSTPNSFAINKGGTQHGTSESARSDHPKEAQSIVSPTLASLPVTIKPPVVSTDEQVSDSKVCGKLEPPKVIKPSVEPDSAHFHKDPKPNIELQSKSGADHSRQHPAPTTKVAEKSLETAPMELASAVGNVDGGKVESVTRSSTGREIQTIPGKEGNSQPTQQVVGQDTAAADPVDSLRNRYSETPNSEGTSDLHQGLDSTASGVSGDVSGSTAAGIVEGGYSLNSGTDKVGTEKNSLNKSKSNNDGSDHVSSSLKATEVIDATGRDTDVLEMGHRTDVAGTVQKEMQSAVSHPDAAKLDLEGLSPVDGGNNLTRGSVVGSLNQNDVTKSDMSGSEMASNKESVLEASSKHDEDVVDNPKSSVSSAPAPVLSKSSSEPNKAKNNVSKGKKKRKDLLKKADDAGTMSDLYMAYKAPEEKKETDISTDNNLMSNNQKLVAADASHENVTPKEQEHPGKTEPDDWEDAADSAPKLERSRDAEDGKMMHHEEEGVTAKKYSRDFLLTFSEQFNELPEGFEITSDVANILICPRSNAGRADREHPSPGRVVDRPSGAVRVDRPGGGMMEPDRWSKVPVPVGSDHGYGNMGFRPGHGNNFGVLRNPRPQVPVQYPGGILPGPMQPMVAHRNNSDSDRWRKAGNFEKHFISPPQTPMHKAERKYEVGKITDEEQAKQRRLKGILNKLTPQNFDKLFEQVKEVNIDNAVTLTGVISQIFDKALMEPTFCEMYANFCHYLALELPDLSVDNQKITFKRLLLNKCQEEFERGEREEEEANKIESEGETKQSDEEREEKRLKARRRMLGNIRLIGELYKKRMLTERIMHECIKKLLGHYQTPDEEDIEALCKLMSTIGEMIDHPRAKEHMDVYFDMIAKLSNDMKLSSRVRFLLKDTIDLRKNKWQQRRKVEGPKKIEEVHRDAAHERHAQTSRLSRGPSMNSSMRRGQPADFGPRGSSMLSSPVGQMGSFRGLSPQVRGYAPDARMNERIAFENRALSVPLPHRPLGDDSITLVPQGGLARGMSIRGQSSVPNVLSADISSGHLDTRRMPGGLNNYSSVSERPAYNSREDSMPRFVPERFGGAIAYDQSRSHELNPSYVNRDNRNLDHNFDRPRPPPSAHGISTVPNASSEKISADKVWPEERLRELSITTIKEFYSAKDEKEVVLCLKDLNAPSCYPSVVTIWVSDSFERKDMERDLLAKLLVSLSRPQGGILSHAQLVEGFASVLTSLEDMVTDAPRAPEFLGRLFAKAIVENVISLREIGRLLHEGGEEPGCLREAGLAGDVLGSTLESIKSEKGDEALTVIRANAHLQLEDFRPPDHRRSKKLELFI